MLSEWPPSELIFFKMLLAPNSHRQPVPGDQSLPLCAIFGAGAAGHRPSYKAWRRNF